MTTEQRDDSARNTVFGEVADLYDAVRRDYPAALVDEVLRYADLGGRGAVEIGAGTGKATVAFAERGVPIVCVEPDPRMAELLRRKTAGYPGVRIEQAGFESWERGGRTFGLLFAATAWHWVPEEVRWDLAYEALAPGGAVALFWNHHGVMDPEMHAALAEIDARYGLTFTPHTMAGWNMSDTIEPPEGDESVWSSQEALMRGRFTDLRDLRFKTPVHYPTKRYIDYLTSISAYRIMSDEARAAVQTEVAALLDAHGGGIDMVTRSDLLLARAVRAD
nr:class I SAM-dependent methyltransferase [Streptomyces sp. 846.5]